MIALLRSKREAAEITQTQLAERLNLSQTVISKIEICERRLDVIELIDVCNALNISYTDFFNELKTKI